MLSKTFDPANRLVADTLEAEWNGKLRALNEAQQEYERLRQTDHLATDEAQRARIAVFVYRVGTARRRGLRESRG